MQISGKGNGRRIKFSRHFIIEKILFSVMKYASVDVVDKEAQLESVEEYEFKDCEDDVKVVATAKHVSIEDKLALFSSIQNIHGVYFDEICSIRELAKDRNEIIVQQQRLISMLKAKLGST